MLSVFLQKQGGLKRSEKNVFVIDILCDMVIHIASQVSPACVL